MLPDFNPRTSTTPPIEKTTQEPSNHLPYIMIYASMLLCCILLIIFVLAIYISCKRREDKRNRRNRLIMPNWNGNSNASPITNLVEQSSGSGKSRSFTFAIRFLTIPLRQGLVCRCSFNAQSPNKFKWWSQSGRGATAKFG
jgi:hypothetical protein